MIDQDIVLKVAGLSVALPKGADRDFAAQEVDFSLNRGETLCVVGESGSGKSVSAHAMARLLPKALKPVAGAIEFDGKDILNLSESAMRAIRGARIAMIFQEPMTALNPVLRCGDQICEMFEAHQLYNRGERRSRALDLLTEVGIPDPKKAFSAYPHELSGGQRQRVMIAMALALEPAVIIADEPTTALDVTTQAQILELLRNLREKHGTSILFITHDFGVVAEIADRVVVMRQGEIVESGTANDVLTNPQHDYTKALLAAVPNLDQLNGKTGIDASAPAVLSVRNLKKTYRGRGLINRRDVVAVDNISLDLARGETLGVVGESGSGKSTLGRCIMKLTDSDSGEIFLGDTEIRRMSNSQFRPICNTIQMVFQDPFASLNPQRTIGRIIADGPIIHGTPEKQALAEARELLKRVGLDESAMDRYPREFSGGQRQRVGIARALALKPKILVADEPVSALDVSVQAQVLELINDLKKQLSLSMIFITHDLRVAAQVCDRIAVMRKGQVVELSPATEIFFNPVHDYTRSLLNAVPGLENELISAREKAVEV